MVVKISVFGIGDVVVAFAAYVRMHANELPRMRNRQRAKQEGVR